MILNESRMAFPQTLAGDPVNWDMLSEYKFSIMYQESLKHLFTQ